MTYHTEPFSKLTREANKYSNEHPAISYRTTFTYPNLATKLFKMSLPPVERHGLATTDAYYDFIRPQTFMMESILEHRPEIEEVSTWLNWLHISGIVPSLCDISILFKLVQNATDPHCRAELQEWFEKILEDAASKWIIVNIALVNKEEY